jgi:uncharacterized membrane protein YcaP (DUF421 family)
MWFGGWESLLRILIHGTLGYIALVLMLRLSGKRTLSKMNAFDFVITIALGSAFATLLISDMVPLTKRCSGYCAPGDPAVGGILDLCEVGALRVDREGQSSACLLEEQVPEDVLRRERITHEEVQAAIRDNSMANGSGAAAVLETDGSLSVVPLENDEWVEAMERVRSPGIRPI